MALTARVTTHDRGFERIRREIRRLEGRSIKVGIQSDAGAEPDGAAIVNVAAWNEFGTEHIPSRPFMRHMADTKRGSLHQVATRAYNTLLSGGSADATLGIVGQWYEGEQKWVLRDGPWTPNAPSTVAAKGSATPLIDTARMVNAIRYVIVSGHPTS